MKKKSSTNGKNQKSYTPEFKQQIVDLYNSGTKKMKDLEIENEILKKATAMFAKER